MIFCYGVLVVMLTAAALGQENNATSAEMGMLVETCEAICGAEKCREETGGATVSIVLDRCHSSSGSIEWPGTALGSLMASFVSDDSGSDTAVVIRWFADSQCRLPLADSAGPSDPTVPCLAAHCCPLLFKGRPVNVTLQGSPVAFYGVRLGQTYCLGGGTDCNPVMMIVIICTCIGGVLLVAILSVAVWYCVRKKRAGGYAPIN